MWNISKCNKKCLIPKPLVWTCIATYFYGHPPPRTDRQCTRPGRDAELSGGTPTLVCTPHTRLSCRGRAPYSWFGPGPEVDQVEPDISAHHSRNNPSSMLQPRIHIVLCLSTAGYIADLHKMAVAEWLQSFSSVRGPMERLGII